MTAVPRHLKMNKTAKEMQKTYSTRSSNRHTAPNNIVCSIQQLHLKEAIKVRSAVPICRALTHLGALKAPNPGHARHVNISSPKAGEKTSACFCILPGRRKKLGHLRAMETIRLRALRSG